MSFTVKEEPIENLEIRFSPPVPVSGRILGLEPGEIAHLVSAEEEHPDRSRPGKADQDGGFLIPDLAPGTWTIYARRGERTMSTTIRIAPGDRATVDLVFRNGEDAPDEPVVAEP